MDNELQSGSARTTSQVMELQQLIAGPLVSTIEADTMSTQRYLEMLQLIAFEEPKEGNNGVMELRTLTFSYSETNVNGTSKKIVKIPLLTLVPLPLLQIKEADFDYDVNILDAISSSVNESFNYGAGKIEQPSGCPAPFRLRASLAAKSGNGKYSETTEQKLSANMKVHVKMRQADMPAGLANMLHITASNLLVEDAEAPEHSNTDGIERSGDE